MTRRSKGERSRTAPVEAAMARGDEDSFRELSILVRRRLDWWIARPDESPATLRGQFLVLALGRSFYRRWVTPPPRELSAILRERCPGCGYALAGIEEAAAIKSAWVRIGPRACPECGRTWPLIPPAISGE